MKLIARLIILTLMPVAVLTACTKDADLGQANMDAGNAAATDAANDATTLKQYGVNLDSGYIYNLNGMSLHDSNTVHDLLVHFRQRTQDFLAYGMGRGVNFKGDSEKNARNDLAQAREMIEMVDNHISDLNNGLRRDDHGHDRRH